MVLAACPQVLPEDQAHAPQTLCVAHTMAVPGPRNQPRWLHVAFSNGSAGRVGRSPDRGERQHQVVSESAEPRPKLEFFLWEP